MKTIREIIENGNFGFIAELEAREKERDARRDEERIALQKEAVKLRNELAILRDKANGDYWVWQGDGTDDLESLVCPILIHPSDMRKRDEIERERVETAIHSQLESGLSTVVVNVIYPPPEPPKPAMLPAGYYWKKFMTENKWQCLYHPVSFAPHPNWEHRPWNDPPLEVTGTVKAEPVQDRLALMAEALGKVLVKVGVINNDVSLSGPQLLLAAESFLDSLKVEPAGSFCCCECEKTFPTSDRSGYQPATMCRGCYESWLKLWGSSEPVLPEPVMLPAGEYWFRFQYPEFCAGFVGRTIYVEPFEPVQGVEYVLCVNPFSSSPAEVTSPKEN